jgi:eukaryotic-like serine/threonine-protein kinase
MPESRDQTDAAERWARVTRVLDQLLDHDRREWPALVITHCGDDAELRAEVESLLAEYDTTPTVLNAGTGALAVALITAHDDDRTPRSDPLTNTLLGPWRVREQIGQGGMSRVFLGERADGAFEQRVAIKVLRAGLDTVRDLERFRSERQILATLVHPYIARLLDGGVAPDGRPYLVLEYIEGEPLTTYCATRSLSREARLHLFLDVAEATQAAHRQLVVHRDLKPSNILVGADGHPRLLDFGIAKLLDASDDAMTSTGSRQRWLTPQYAAPEQFSHEPITTATDVYQLGVVLYELLSARRPFDEASPQSLEVRVLLDEPAPPSRFEPTLRGDLDAIVLKALRKEPQARYASVAELAADVTRVLDGDAVQARTGSRAYRWRRFARRRAVPLAFGAAATIGASIYLTTLSIQNRRIAQALETATTERAKAEQVTNFLLGLFAASDPRAGGGDTITARTLLARGDARADALERQPEVQAALIDLVGRVRQNLGALTAARTQLERALAIRRRSLGREHPDVAQSLFHLAQLDEATGRLPTAIQGYEQALRIQQTQLGDSSRATLLTLFNLARAVHAIGRLRDGAALFERWEKAVIGRPTIPDSARAEQLQHLGQYLVASARRDPAILARAERVFRDARAIRTTIYGPSQADVAISTQSLANVRWMQGAVPEAESLFQQAQATLSRAYPAGHLELIVLLSDYASRLDEAGRTAESIPLLRDALRYGRTLLTPNDPSLASLLVVYGRALHRVGDERTAAPLLREAVGLMEASLGKTSVMTVQSQVSLGVTLTGLGSYVEAESLLVNAFVSLSQSRGASSRQAQGAARALVSLYERMGRVDDVAHYRAALTSP